MSYENTTTLPAGYGSDNLNVATTRDYPSEESEAALNIDLRDLLFMVRRNLLMIVGAIVVALLLGLAVSLLMTPKYVATAQLQIDQSADRVLGESESVQPDVAIQDADRFLQTQIDVLNSRTMALRVARSLNLIGNEEFFSEMNTELPEQTTAMDYNKSLTEATIKLIKDNLSIALPRNSRVVSISFESPSSELSARLANAYAENYIAYNLQRKYNSSEYAREFLSDQLSEAKTRLEASEEALNGYARSAGLIITDTPGDQGADAGRSQSLNSSSLVLTNSALVDAATDRAEAEARWQAVRNVAPLSIPEVLANPAVQDLVKERAAAQAALRQEQSRHLDEHPNVVMLREQVAELDQQVDALASQIKRSIFLQYQSAQRRENEIQNQVDQFRNVNEREQDLGVQYGILARETETNRVLYEGLLQRYKDISAAAGIATNNVSMVDDATPPVFPSSPNLLINLALSLVGGIILAGGLVLMREQLDDTIRVTEDLEFKLGLSPIGAVPVYDGDETIEEALEDAKSHVAEAFSSIRTALLYSTSHGLPDCLSVTSSEAGEGKTTCSYALAKAFGRLGKSVVIVGADIRRPSIHKLLDVDNDQGLTDLLVSERPPHEFVVKTAHENVSLLPAGPTPPNPTDLLGGTRIREVIDSLREEFDLVLIDGPPVLGLADALILGQIADGVLFVVESNRGSRGRTKSALRRLRQANVNLIGGILTKIDSRRLGSSYGYYYQQDYYNYETEAPSSKGGLRQKLGL
ncbi:GumC family protein [Qipengyuania aquimaris]|uniref:GumC family protein n=1 Tax=Qipengyuania aquimaris TaxID=255984 RepID=UPI001CD4D50D|nr:polysaccharide biosynthesis tyrosine autokinase [Qipengyuania aquimaris]MCA0902364.1 polysaccharide biosynthesis tyrosine autokinase [Qipengyuania aquimaris]